MKVWNKAHYRMHRKEKDIIKEKKEGREIEQPLYYEISIFKNNIV
jgi:hypothetical protein